MNQWLANNHDAIALGIIVFMVLAGHAATFEAVTVVRLPDLFEEARDIAGRARVIVERCQDAPMRAIRAVAYQSACLAPPGPF